MAKGLDKETLEATLVALTEFAARRLPDQKLLELDARDEFPADIIREMCGPQLGIQLFFIPEAFNGMGGAVSGALTCASTGTALTVSSAMQTNTRNTACENSACPYGLASFSLRSQMRD